jgi:hypothetical protein
MENQTNSRAGKCYKIALAIVEIGSDALILVHGCIAGIEHAWIVADDGKYMTPSSCPCRCVKLPSHSRTPLYEKTGIEDGRAERHLWALAIAQLCRLNLYLSRKNDANEKRLSFGCSCCFSAVVWLQDIPKRKYWHSLARLNRRRTRLGLRLSLKLRGAKNMIENLQIKPKILKGTSLTNCALSCRHMPIQQFAAPVPSAC